jgi:hypothetical protein
MQRNFKKLMIVAVVTASLVTNSVTFAAGKPGGPSIGSSAGQHSLSVNTGSQFQGLSSLHATQNFKPLNSIVTTNNLKTTSLPNNSLHQIQVNNGIQPLNGKTPVKLNVGNNLQNLHLNQQTLKLNGVNSHLLSGNKNLLIGNKGINQAYIPKGPLFNSKYCSPFCTPFCGKFCSPCWNTFCTPYWWWNTCSCWYPWYSSCWSPFCSQYWSPCYSTCYSPFYSVGLPWLCSFGYYTLGYGGSYAVASGPAIDVELVEVRQIDAGDVQQQLGPAYRIAFRNNSAVDINHAFSVGAMASTSRRLSKEFPMATVQVPGIKAGTTMAADIRLPLDAQRMGVNYMGQTVPFAYLYAVVDSLNQLNDVNRNNNSTFQGRLDIPMVSN